MTVELVLRTCSSANVKGVYAGICIGREKLDGSMGVRADDDMRAAGARKLLARNARGILNAPAKQTVRDH